MKQYTKRGNEISTQLGSHKHTPKWYKGLVKVLIDQNAKPAFKVVEKDFGMSDATIYKNKRSQIIEMGLFLPRYNPLQFCTKIEVITIIRNIGLTDKGLKKLEYLKRRKEKRKIN